MDPPIKLPVIATAKLPYIYAFAHRGSLARLCWPWFAILAAWQVLRTLPVIAAEPPTISSVLTGLDDVLFAVAGVAVAVAWHRSILLGEPVPRVPRFARNEWRYAWAWVRIGLVMLLPSLALWAFSLALMPMILILHGAARWVPLGVVMLCYVAAQAVLIVRLQLALPAAALGGRVKLGDSLDATTGNTGRLIAIWIFVSLPWLVAQLILNLSVTSGPRDGDGPGIVVVSLLRIALQRDCDWLAVLVTSLLRIALLLPFTVIIVGMLSFSYQVLRRMPRTANTAAG